MTRLCAPEPSADLVSDVGSMLKYLLMSGNVTECDKRTLSMTCLTVIARTSQVWRCNAFRSGLESQVMCLYETGSIMNHSCAATCVRHYGREYSCCVRARLPLEPGDEISISYLPDVDLILAAPLRRAHLMEWMFVCECDRCKQHSVDYSRGFKCRKCSDGIIFASSLETGAMEPCSSCDHKLKRIKIAKLSHEEQEIAERLANTDRWEYENLVSEQKLALEVLANNHWISFMYETYLASCWESMSQKYVDQAFRAQRHQKHLEHCVEFVDTVLPLPNSLAANLSAQIGDCQFQKGNKKQAKEYYNRAHEILTVISGRDHPDTKMIKVLKSECS